MVARTVPWEEIRDAQIARAEEYLRHQPLTPDVDAGGWWVYSSTGSGERYLVSPKWKRAERQAHPGRKNGHWWQVLTCTCTAAQRGYMLCWHKAAVWVYWRACREANRMEGIGPYLLRDGPNPTSPDEPVNEGPTPTVAPSVGRSTRSTRPRGIPKKDATPSAGVARKKRPKTH